MLIRKFRKSPTNTTAKFAIGKISHDPSELAISKPNRNFHIDLVKFVALILVIAHHANAETNIITQLTASNYSAWWTLDIYQAIVMVAVPLFVMASGALLLNEAKSAEPIRIFLRKRVARLMLPFLFWAIMYMLFRATMNHEVIPINFNTFSINILNIPYYHFWFIFMIAGLYLLTPILRIIVANAPRSVIKYGLGLWLFTFSILPLLKEFFGINLGNGYLLDASTLAIYVGFYVLGAILPKEPIKYFKWCLLGAISGITAMAVITAIATAYNGGVAVCCPLDTSLQTIVGAVSVFMLLGGVAQVAKQRFSTLSQKFISKVSTLSLGIYLSHVLILECLERGYFGVKISMTLMNPIYEVPLMTLIVFALSFVLIYSGSKIPVLRRLIN